MSIMLFSVRQVKKPTGRLKKVLGAPCLVFRLSRMNPKMLRPSLDERKDYLAKIATIIFAEKGYRETSLQEICEAAGISKGGIYHYFKGKEDILFYIIRKGHELWVVLLKDSVRECQKKSFGPERTFRELVYTYCSFIYNKKKIALLLLNDRHKLTGDNRIRLREIEQNLYRTLKNQLMKIPDINNQLNTSLISFMIIASSHWMVTWLKETGEMSQDQAINQMIEIILHGVIDKGQ